MRALIDAKADQTTRRNGTTTAFELWLSSQVKEGAVLPAVAPGDAINARNAVRSNQ